MNKHACEGGHRQAKRNIGTSFLLSQECVLVVLPYKCSKHKKKKEDLPNVARAYSQWNQEFLNGCALAPTNYAAKEKDFTSSC